MRSATPVPMAPDAAITPAGKRSAADIPVPGAAPARELRERKHVLVVEGQLTGLGALRRRVGDARADKTVADFFRIAEHIAFKQEAHAHRQGAPGEASFAYVIGLPVAGEDDPSRAIRLALALVDALDGIGRDVEPELRLSVGIQRGVAVVRRTGPTWDYELPAETTSIAQRLAGEAQGGEVLVGGGVYRIARNDWNFEELTAIDLPEGTTDTGKPIAELMLAAGLTGSGTDPGEGASPRTARVYRLRGPKERSERLKERQQGGGIFIGRELELKTLRETYRDCQLRRGKRMVLVSGEPGIGKRALVAAFLKGLGPGDAMVLRAAARAATRDTPYAIIADLARDMMGLADGAEPREVQRRLTLAAAALYPGEEQSREVVALTQTMGMLLGVKVGGTSLGEIDADERHHRILAALQRVEERLSRDTPLIIVIEDLHWIDSASAEVMTALLGMNTPLPIMGISTARPDERILARTGENQQLVIRLDELPAKARDELLAMRFAPGEDVSALTSEIVAKAGGNPFYLNELIESLVERGVLVEVPPGSGAPPSPGPRLLRWVRKDVALAVPASLELAVATRLDRLPATERETLTRAAVLGRKLSAAEVEVLTGRPAAADLEALGRKQVLDPAPQGWQFKNDLMLEVAYELLPVDERAELHRRAAEMLLAQPGFREGQDDARLARHHERAGDAPAAVARWLSAGHHALATRASIEALSHFGRALALMPRTDHAARFLAHAEREGILRLITRRPQQLREIHLMRRAAQGAGNQAGVAEALLRLAQLYLDVGRAPQAKKTLADALDAARAAESKLAEASVWRTQAQVARAIGKPEEALALCQRALDLLDDSAQAMAERGLILNVRGGVYYTMSRLRDAIESWAESLIIHRKLRAPRMEARALNNMGIVFAALGEFDEALTHYKRSLKIDADLGNRSGVATKLSNIGQVYLEVGLYEKAEQYLGKSLALCRELKEQRVGVDATISLAQVYLRQGVLGRARSLLERGLELAVREGDRYQEIRAMQYLALTHLAANESLAGALELAQRSTRLAGDSAMGVGLVYGHAISGLALAALGRGAAAVDESRLAIDEMSRQEHPEGAEEILAIHGRLLVSAGRADEGKAALERATQLIRDKAAQLRDEALRRSYLGSPPVREILDAAEGKSQ
jgi:tetratricopeptide (TPR) repeat protein